MSATSETTDAPHVDAKSPKGHIVATVEYLAQRFKGQRSEVLRANTVGASPSGMRFWFRDVPEVRRELGMEEV